MTLVVTRNAPARYRGFLASVMLEVSPGTYVGPRLNRGVRERIWTVCLDWAATLPPDGSITMVWRERAAPGGLGLEVLGGPKTVLVEHDGIWLDRHELTAGDQETLRHTDMPT